jgi:hypothetical protein
LVCSISASNSYANDVKKEVKNETKVEKVAAPLLQDASQGLSNLVSAQMSPEDCGTKAWGVFYAMKDLGYTDAYAYAAAKGVYNECIKNDTLTDTIKP